MAYGTAYRGWGPMLLAYTSLVTLRAVACAVTARYTLDSKGDVRDAPNLL